MLAGMAGMSFFYNHSHSLRLGITLPYLKNDNETCEELQGRPEHSDYRTIFEFKRLFTKSLKRVRNVHYRDKIEGWIMTVGLTNYRLAIGYIVGSITHFYLTFLVVA